MQDVRRNCCLTTDPMTALLESEGSTLDSIIKPNCPLRLDVECCIYDISIEDPSLVITVCSTDTDTDAFTCVSGNSVSSIRNQIGILDVLRMRVECTVFNGTPVNGPLCSIRSNCSVHSS